MKKTMLKTNLKKLSLIFVISIVGLFASNKAHSEGVDNRIRTLIYGENDIHVITSMFGYQTIIELEPEEKIQTISIGNPNLFKIVPVGNRIFVKAIVSNQITNMFVITDRRQYQFDISSYAKEASEIIYIAKFLYPEYIENLEAKTNADKSSSPMSLYNSLDFKVKPRSSYADLRNTVPSTPSLSKLIGNIQPVSMPSPSASNPYVGKNDPKSNFLVKQSQSNR